ncbi:MAG: PEP-CTERM sorting domain-containing protein [Candidatus Korobacteraceae bacterium]|jgi:hypothetical protein
MKNVLRILAFTVVALGLFYAPAAKADTFDFTYSGSGYSASGVFTTGNAGSPFTVTGITGTADGSAITSLSLYAGADQLLYFPPSGGSYADGAGISFATLSGVDYNIYAYNGGIYLLVSTVDPVGYPENGVPITMSAVTPEPITLLLFGTGLMGIGGMVRRKLSR